MILVLCRNNEIDDINIAEWKEKIGKDINIINIKLNDLKTYLCNSINKFKDKGGIILLNIFIYIYIYL